MTSKADVVRRWKFGSVCRFAVERLCTNFVPMGMQMIIRTDRELGVELASEIKRLVKTWTQGNSWRGKYQGKHKKGTSGEACSCEGSLGVVDSQTIQFATAAFQALRVATTSGDKGAILVSLTRQAFPYCSKDLWEHTTCHSLWTTLHDAQNCNLRVWWNVRKRLAGGVA